MVEIAHEGEATVSWCRWGEPDSDVHVYETVERSGSAMLVCCHGADHFRDHADFRTKRFGELLAHLQGHADDGLKVPARAVEALGDERRTYGDIVRTARERTRASAGKRGRNGRPIVRSRRDEGTA